MSCFSCIHWSVCFVRKTLDKFYDNNRHILKTDFINRLFEHCQKYQEEGA